MPRDGSGIYTKPFPDVVTGTTVASTVHNGIVADVETDLNAPRPIIAGGTGANSAMQARANLQAERAFQTISNFDSAVWECGSFYAPPGTTGSPVAGHAYIGIVYGDPTGTLTIEARDITAAANVQDVYTRTRIAGLWGAWSGGIAGQKLDGNLEIEKSVPTITLDTLANSEQNIIFGDKINLHRWALVLGNAVAESGTSTGSDLGIVRYNNSGVFIDIPMVISRANGAVLHPLGTDWGTGSIRFKYTGVPNTLVWDKDLNNADRVIWDSSICPASATQNGYQKHANGIIFQWGFYSGGGDVTITLPTGFPTGPFMAVVSMASGSALAATTALTAHVVQITNTQIQLQSRYTLTGGTVGMATQPLAWVAIGI